MAKKIADVLDKLGEAKESLNALPTESLSSSILKGEALGYLTEAVEYLEVMQEKTNSP